jgi:phosphoribosylanthranilate isomerase
VPTLQIDPNRAYDSIMSRTRVKICGVMRVEDAVAAARLGADAVGMVFYPRAKRCITRDRAREIILALPPYVTPVGLFADEPPQVILDAAAELNLSHVQLQGEESPDEVGELAGLRVIKAIRVQRETISGELAKWRKMIGKLGLTNLAGIVLDTGGTAHLGGSGVANDWALINDLQLRGEFKDLPNMIAAGGLTPATVGNVVREIRPWAVDVSSGVESAFGEKSEAKIAEFIRQASAASEPV